MRYETEAVTELGWLKAWENNISWEVVKDFRKTVFALNINNNMEKILTKPVSFFYLNLH